MRIFRHLTYTDRLRMETMLKDRKPPRDIASRLGFHISTIYREMKRGRYKYLNTELIEGERYSPDIAYDRYRANLAAKGAPLKIGNDLKLSRYIEKKIIEDRYSPAAVLGEIKVKGMAFDTMICTSTLYSYIDKGIFLQLTNKHLPERGKRKRIYRHVKPARPPKGESIENRPALIGGRDTFGHWEMDLLQGKRNTKPNLLVLTERYTRHEIAVPLKDKTAASVVHALDNLEHRYGKLFSRVFHTITVDNGPEFADCTGMEHSRRGKRQRTKVYYCHPYSSWERGSNENQNKMLRRRFPKGTDFGTVTAEEVCRANDWLNNYPRALFGFRSSADMFSECLKAL